MRTYSITVSAQGEAKYFTANLTDAEYTAIKVDTIKHRYNVYIDKGHVVDNKSNYDELVKWLNEVRLTKKIYMPSKVEHRKVKLPDYIHWDSDGQYLYVDINVPFETHTHLTCIMELKCIEWILSTFPTAVFYCSRAKFKLPKSKIKDSCSLKEVSYSYMSSTNSIHEKSVTYEEIEIEL